MTIDVPGPLVDVGSPAAHTTPAHPGIQDGLAAHPLRGAYAARLKST